MVCSTKSANSKWVNKEIIDFKMMHGEERIFPIIIDGEPFARESDKFEDASECFPEALKYKVDGEGNLTDERTSVLASSTIEKEDGRELAKLKLIAGVLGVPQGVFQRRDLEQQKKDRNRNIGVWSIVSFVIIGFAVFSWMQKGKVENELYINSMQQGILYRDFFNEPIKAKHIFAKTLDSSPNKEKELLNSRDNGFTDSDGVGLIT